MSDSGKAIAAGTGQITDVVFLDEASLGYNSSVEVCGKGEVTLVSLTYTYTPLLSS